MAETIPHWINGTREPGSSGCTGPVYDPATGKERARVAFASIEEVDRAVSAASAAFSDWRNASLTNRTQILFRFRNLLDGAKDELSEIIA